MVKHVVKWVHESVSDPIPVVETASEVVPTSFAPPGVAGRRHYNYRFRKHCVINEPVAHVARRNAWWGYCT